MKKTIVISAVNLVSGGALTILRDCLSYLNSSPLLESHEVVALVHDRKLADFPNIRYIELPKSKQHWINRLYYEYVYFRRLSLKIKPFLWLSLHDMTPNVHAERRAVYMHNPSMSNTIRKNDWKFDKTYILFTLFYKYLYRINLRKNDFYVVQQDWLRRSFSRIFGISTEKIIVARPIDQIAARAERPRPTPPASCRTFFYPSLARPFKNFEVICQAVEILNRQGVDDFNVVLTINGTESKYAAWVYNRYKGVKHIEFAGLLDRRQMNEQYAATDCLIFPSRLETWGLPVSEFARYGRPIILADKEYAHETAQKCHYVSFFDPDDPQQLAKLMCSAMGGNYNDFKSIPQASIDKPLARDYQEFFNCLLR